MRLGHEASSLKLPLPVLMTINLTNGTRKQLRRHSGLQGEPGFVGSTVKNVTVPEGRDVLFVMHCQESRRTQGCVDSLRSFRYFNSTKSCYNEESTNRSIS
ncbi:unnamed protein product [Lepeophtheirus salmonis]|uniref:(salmon louse) hypothetical protein n=1 Tax=Lepeophtheirus salmonis TaxID=72036 RepID=A0A7R8CVK7_LEPSM|nr:unnamed protein product [Lepeophtheirus salmonis]CAF2913049.1 unnamed protein product [Lepeophtheirus salmonis]